MFIGFLISQDVRADYAQPTTAPVDDNTPGFIVIGDSDQVKTGPLRLGTDDIASTFNYQLEVIGDGADAENAVIENNLQVWNNQNKNNSTLFVDSDNSKVCFGTCFNNGNAILEVSDRGVIIENTNDEGIAVEAYSEDAEAIYGRGASGGIYGLASGDNYGIYAISTLATAIEGFNTAQPNPVYSSVAGISSTGIGIYGTNTNKLGLWSGYFVGRVESNELITAAKFLSKNPGHSLAPFTSGQLAGEYSYTNSSVKYFDGSHLWFTKDGELVKIRATDNVQILKTSAGINAVDVIFDKKNIWAAVDNGSSGDKVSKIDPITGTELCSYNVSDPVSIVFTGVSYWVISNSTGSAYNIDENCLLSDIPVSNNPVAIVDPGDYRLGELIYDGTYIWALATHITNETGSLISINPSNGDAFRWDGYLGKNPIDIFYDNTFYWITSSTEGNLSRLNLEDNKICSILDSNDNPVACEIDTDCSSQSLGNCGFKKLNKFDEYSVSNDSSRLSNSPAEILFDGNYLWLTNEWVSSTGVTNYELVRMMVADPNNLKSVSLGDISSGLVFDGTYIWVSLNNTNIAKYYAGSNYGSTDLRDTLAIQDNSTLNTQSGYFSIEGSGRFEQDLTASGDIISTNNKWGSPVANDTIINEDLVFWENSSDLSGATYVYSLIATSDDRLLAGTYPSGDVFISADHGQTWTATTAPVGATAVYSLLESSDGTIYAGTWPNGDVFRYNPTLSDWTNITAAGNNLTGALTVNSLIEARDGTIWAGTHPNGDVFIYNPFTDTWATSGNLNDVTDGDAEYVYSLLEIIEDGFSEFYAATYPGGNVFISNDLGVTWTNTGNLNDALDGDATYAYSLIEHNNTVYAGTGPQGNIFTYNSTLNQWTSVTLGASDLVDAGNSATQVRALHTAKNDNSIYAATSPWGDIYRSTDNGVTWANTGNLSEPIFNEVTYLYALAATSDRKLYAGAYRGNVFEGRFGILNPGTYTCPEIGGHFITNVETDSQGRVILIECRPL